MCSTSSTSTFYSYSDSSICRCSSSRCIFTSSSSSTYCNSNNSINNCSNMVSIHQHGRCSMLGRLPTPMWCSPALLRQACTTPRRTRAGTLHLSI